MASEWVCLVTWVDEATETFYEAGAVYLTEPLCFWTEGARKLEPGEHVARCPRCGQRFAAVEGKTAESARDLHVDGGKDCPSICRHMPARRLRLVQKGGA